MTHETLDAGGLATQHGAAQPPRDFAMAWRDFNFAQRRSGYFVLVSVLFALILAGLVGWLCALLLSILPRQPGMQPAASVAAGSRAGQLELRDIHLTGGEITFRPAGSEASGESKQIASVSLARGTVRLPDDLDLSPRTTSSREKTWWLKPILQLPLVVGFAYMSMIMWMYFSRVIIYHSESAAEEAYTFLLGLTLLTTLGVLAIRPEFWAYGSAVCLFGISLKNRSIYRSLVSFHLRRIEGDVPVPKYLSEADVTDRDGEDTGTDEEKAVRRLRRRMPGKLSGLWAYIPLVPKWTRDPKWGRQRREAHDQPFGPTEDPDLPTIPPLIGYAYRWCSVLLLWALVCALAGGARSRLLSQNMPSELLDLTATVGTTENAIRTGEGLLAVVLVVGLLCLMFKFGKMFSNAYSSTVDSITKANKKYAEWYFGEHGVLPFADDF